MVKMVNVGDRLVVAWEDEGRGRDGVGVWDFQTQAVIYRMDERQSPVISHRELYTISCDKL